MISSMNKNRKHDEEISIIFLILNNTVGRYGLLGGSARNICGSGKISKANKKKRALELSKLVILI